MVPQHEKMTCKLLDYLWEDVFKNGSPKLEERDFKFIKELIHKSPEMVSPLLIMKCFQTTQSRSNHTHPHADLSSFGFLSQSSFLDLYLGFQRGFLAHSSRGVEIQIASSFEL